MDIPFAEQIRVIADTLPQELQARILGREIDDGEWVDPAGGDGHRVTVVAGLIFALKGTYSNYGIESWFDRPRRELGGMAPVDALSGDWNAGQPNVRTVLHLALFHAGPASPHMHLH